MIQITVNDDEQASLPTSTIDCGRHFLHVANAGTNNSMHAHYSDLIGVSSWPSTPYCNITAESLSLGMPSYAFSKSEEHTWTAKHGNFKKFN